MKHAALPRSMLHFGVTRRFFLKPAVSLFLIPLFLHTPVTNSRLQHFSRGTPNSFQYCLNQMHSDSQGSCTLTGFATAEQTTFAFKMLYKLSPAKTPAVKLPVRYSWVA